MYTVSPIPRSRPAILRRRKSNGGGTLLSRSRIILSLCGSVGIDNVSSMLVVADNELSKVSSCFTDRRISGYVGLGTGIFSSIGENG